MALRSRCRRISGDRIWREIPASPLRNQCPEDENCGCFANLHDHIRNDVEVRSIAGSVVLKDCTLSSKTATWNRLYVPLFPLNFLKVSTPSAGHRIMPPTTPLVALLAGPSVAAPHRIGVP